MTFANKTSKFAEKSHAKRLILQFCTTKTVLFCKIGKSKLHKIGQSAISKLHKNDETKASAGI